MFGTGLMVLTAPVQTIRSQVSNHLRYAAKQIKDTLYVHLQPHSMVLPVKDPQSRSFQLQPQPANREMRNLIGMVYSQAAAICGHIDVRVLLGHIHNNKHAPVKPQSLQCKQCDVILADFKMENVDSMKQVIKTAYSISNVGEWCTLSDNGTAGEKNTDTINEAVLPCYPHVVLGGTFDRIHNGHKMLLTESCLMCSEEMTIGVTDGEMNAKKMLNELMQPTDTRIQLLTNLLMDLNPHVKYNIVPITDPFGPSIVVPDMQCIVVSQETLRGGQAVNKRRKERGLSELDVHIIGLMEDVHHSPEEEEKISSSSQRKRMLGDLLKEAKVHSSSTEPYVIGLTGGIATGKSSVCKRLEKLGAAVVDCDKLGHLAYKKGTETFQKVVAEFGDEIVGEDGEINRKVLGPKVFADKKCLEKLNAIVWPGIMELAKCEINQHHSAGHKVVVLDAAVLLEAGWDHIAHEVWVCIIDKHEAVKRIVDRNKLKEDQALQRIESQMSSQARVARANVVLSTLWEYDVTQAQVEKAWGLLQQRIGGLVT